MPSETAPPDNSDSMYPEIEALVESAGFAAVDARFADLRELLSTLKGPRAEQAKKVRKALDRAEELFRHLLDVRGTLAAGAKKPNK